MTPLEKINFHPPVAIHYFLDLPGAAPPGEKITNECTEQVLYGILRFLVSRFVVSLCQPIDGGTPPHSMYIYIYMYIRTCIYIYIYIYTYIYIYMYTWDPRGSFFESNLAA